MGANPRQRQVIGQHTNGQHEDIGAADGDRGAGDEKNRQRDQKSLAGPAMPKPTLGQERRRRRAHYRDDPKHPMGLEQKAFRHHRHQAGAGSAKTRARLLPTRRTSALSRAPAAANSAWQRGRL